MPKQEQNKQNNINNLTHNKQKTMKKQYKEPQIYIENVVVESGIAVSNLDDSYWGKDGMAGQDGWYYEYDGEDL